MTILFFAFHPFVYQLIPNFSANIIDYQIVPYEQQHVLCRSTPGRKEAEVNIFLKYRWFYTVKSHDHVFYAILFVGLH